ncbi:MAG: DUF4434 domain-containing protein [Clostridia bacterium]|nr:DUF4434 domain-containing protein [Clostridia bacterium]
MKPITGTFFEFEHHNRAEGKYYNNALFSFTEGQWRAKIRETAELGMDTLVLMATALYYKSYYRTDTYPYADHLGCPDILEVLLDEADKTGQRVYLSAGFYGNWIHPRTNTTSPEVLNRTLKAMNEITEKYGHHKSIEGWYMPDEWCIRGHFDIRFMRYINLIAAEARKLNKKNKTIIGPYGTRLLKPDDKYVGQLEQLDLDVIAYQDGVGVQKTLVEEEAAFYEGLRRAHDKAGRAALWADMEVFAFEGTVYKSALLPAPWERVKAQMEAISPFVDKIIIYAYEGMMTKPGGIARAGQDGTAEKLYTDYKAWLDSTK